MSAGCGIFYAVICRQDVVCVVCNRSIGVRILDVADSMDVIYCLGCGLESRCDLQAGVVCSESVIICIGMVCSVGIICSEDFVCSLSVIYYLGAVCSLGVCCSLCVISSQNGVISRCWMCVWFVIGVVSSVRL